MVNGEGKHREETIPVVIDHVCSDGNSTEQHATGKHAERCHTYYCERTGHEFQMRLVSCKPLEVPVAMKCDPFNEDNREQNFPVCCPRLLCVVTAAEDRIIRVLGQAGEILPDQPFIDKTDQTSCHCNAFTFDVEENISEDGSQSQGIRRRDTSAMTTEDSNLKSRQKRKAEDAESLLESKLSNIQNTQKLQLDDDNAQSMFDWVAWPFRAFMDHYFKLLRLQIKEAENLSYAYISSN